MYILEEDFVKMASENCKYGSSYAYLLSIGEQYKEAGGVTSDYGLQRSFEKEKDPEIQEYADQYFKGDYDKAVAALKKEGQI